MSMAATPDKKTVIRELMELGKQKGQLTNAHILDAISEIDFDPEQLEKLYDALAQLGIEIVEDSGDIKIDDIDLGFDESKFKITTGIAGAIGTLLAAFGLLNAFQGFLSLMSALIPPLAGVLIASYWIVDGGKKENFAVRPGFSAVGVISFAVGAIFACITGGTFASFPGLVEALPFLNWPFFVGPVNGIVVSLVLYVILAKLFPAKDR